MRGLMKICAISGQLPLVGLKPRSQRIRVEAGRCRGWRARRRRGDESPPKTAASPDRALRDLRVASLRVEWHIRAYLLTTHRTNLSLIGYLGGREWSQMKASARRPVERLSEWKPACPLKRPSPGREIAKPRASKSQPRAGDAFGACKMIQRGLGWIWTAGTELPKNVRDFFVKQGSQGARNAWVDSHPNSEVGLPAWL
jgi:hypothetical protein